MIGQNWFVVDNAICWKVADDLVKLVKLILGDLTVQLLELEILVEVELWIAEKSGIVPEALLLGGVVKRALVIVLIIIVVGETHEG